MEERQMAFFGDENGLPDDIDCLFHLLHQIEPPQELIQRILAQAQTPYSYGALPISQRPRMAKGLLEHLVMMPPGEWDGRQLRRKLC
jgi:hypothetical protein